MDYSKYVIKCLYMNKIKLVFLDTETTGNKPEDVLCQIAYRIVIPKEGEQETFCKLYKPAIPIPPEASAVTHITNKMVADKEPFKESKDFSKIKSLLEDNDSIFIAHNAKFDVGMLEKEGINPKNVICTLRLARELDKENKIPQYRLQYLRYYLDLELEAQAHDALGDVIVLEKIFERLFKKMMDEYSDEEKVIKEMLDISSRPSLMKNINFGKHAGKTVKEVSEIDPGYLKWLLAQKEENNPENEEDWIYTLKYYLGMLQ